MEYVRIKLETYHRLIKCEEKLSAIEEPLIIYEKNGNVCMRFEDDYIGGFNVAIVSKDNAMKEIRDRYRDLKAEYDNLVFVANDRNLEKKVMEDKLTESRFIIDKIRGECEKPNLFGHSLSNRILKIIGE